MKARSKRWVLRFFLKKKKLNIHADDMFCFVYSFKNVNISFDFQLTQFFGEYQ